MSIYVISNDLNIENNLFKIGRTKDTNSEIVTKYQRYLSGARVLLWYPSTLTKYVEDERELLRLFDANRNRTPNGFKNEWLSISFEELKTRMDEYFGQDGEDFDEERRTRTKIFTCMYCNKTLKSKQGLERHNNICTQKEHLERIRQKFESDIQEKLNQQKMYYEEQIEKLELQNKEQIEKLELQNKELQAQIFEIAKQPKTIISNDSNPQQS
jgi:hypothetical protein